MITIHEERVDGRGTLTVEGHAGAGPEGQDIICAAVSMLVSALGRWATDETVRPEVALDKGRSRVRMTVGTDFERGAWELVITGCRMLAERYPGHVRMLFD